WMLLVQLRIATTDTDFQGDPAGAAATPADVEYLLRSTEHYFPGIREKQVCFTNAGVRALVTKPGKESAVSRSHQLVDGERQGSPGLVSVVGGKITGYRAIAEEAVDRIARHLGATSGCTTASASLPGAIAESEKERCVGEAVAAGIPADSAAALLALYGARLTGLTVLCREDPSLARPIHPDYPDIRAQVPLAVSQEYCRNLDDFLVRRTGLAFSPGQGQRAAENVAPMLAAKLGWDAAETRRQHARWETYLSHTSPSGLA
ncbi:MAG: glycerol-3-phosphate dehydrogenase C-terminal domain-containing protein, partial [Bryobacterales bacterium]|nr:glycerol-3-phosphate dehydrogenase C-terminal domain-containing protein [Bryobacterales bacterium]